MSLSDVIDWTNAKIYDQINVANNYDASAGSALTGMLNARLNQ